MNVQDERGRATEVVKRRRMRDEDLLIDRDVLIVLGILQGRKQREVARIFNVTQQMVSRRLAEIPEAVKDGLAKIVGQQSSSRGFVLLDDRQQEAMRALVKRERRRAKA